MNSVQMQRCQRGRSVQKTEVVQRECLSQHYFLELREAVRLLEAWKMEFNNERPHGSLDQRSPIDFREAWQFTRGSNDLEICAPCGTEMG